MNVKSALFKYIIEIAVIGLCFAIVGHRLKSNPKIKVSISHVFQKTKEIDKLYTGVYIIPALDKKYGFLKRDILNHKEVVKGYCKKRYEVFVGYEKISELLGHKEVIDNACHGRTDNLPNPQILAVNCRNTEVRGDYSGDGICYSWDVDEETRREEILVQMKTDNIFGKVNKRGRESLKTLATIFCE